jgi:hypothetical protein
LQRILDEMLNSAMHFAVKFFRTVGTNLLVQANTISHMLANVGHSLLADSGEHVAATAAYYDCVAEWLVAAGGNSNFHKYSTSVLEQLLKQIKPFQKYAYSVFYQKNRFSNFKIPIPF